MTLLKTIITSANVIQYLIKIYPNSGVDVDNILGLLL